MYFPSTFLERPSSLEEILILLFSQQQLTGCGSHNLYVYLEKENELVHVSYFSFCLFPATPK